MQRTKVEEDSQRATTPAYRAPEICDLYSNYPIDKRQDMWALGCLLVLLTTGKHPFEMGEKLGKIFQLRNHYVILFFSNYKWPLLSIIKTRTCTIPISSQAAACS